MDITDAVHVYHSQPVFTCAFDLGVFKQEVYCRLFTLFPSATCI